MGRKIPGKKHNKIKDPLKQQEVRYNRIKNKINMPPLNSEDQDIPKSLLRVMDLKEKVKNGIIPEKTPKRKKSVLKGLISTEIKSKKKFKRLGKPEKAIPVFKQQVGETDRAFMYRVNEMVQVTLNEAKFEDKYRVDVKRNFRTGEIEDVVKRPRDEVGLMLKQIRDKNKKGKKKNVEIQLTKAQKRSKKLAEKKFEQQQNKIDEFKNFQDKVQFGEVVHAPPTLNAPKKGSTENGAPRPGRKDLLLKNILKQNDEISNKNPVRKPNIFQRSSDKGVIDKTVKRKNLPIGVRKQLETTRDEMVNVYRQLKANTIKK